MRLVFFEERFQPLPTPPWFESVSLGMGNVRLHPETDAVLHAERGAGCAHAADRILPRLSVGIGLFLLPRYARSVATGIHCSAILYLKEE
jgi:hypothetical protein